MSARNRMFVEVIFIYSVLYPEAKTPFRARLDSTWFCVPLIRKTDMAQAAMVGRSYACNPATKKRWEHICNGKTTNGS